MTKVISLDLAKRLALYLENVETEYQIQLLPTKIGNKWNKGRLVKNSNGKGKYYKTLTLEEIPKFISHYSNSEGRIYCSLLLQKELWDTFSVLEIFDIKMGEKMLTYLLDNNLLGQKN